MTTSFIGELPEASACLLIRLVLRAGAPSSDNPPYSAHPFDAKLGRVLAPHEADTGAACGHALEIDAGGAAGMNARRAELLGGHCHKLAVAQAARRLVVALPTDDPLLASHLAFGFSLAAYRFGKFKSTTEAEAAAPDCAVLCGRSLEAASFYADLEPVAEAVCYARDLVSEPPNILYPVAFAERLAELAVLGLDVSILREPELQALDMQALLAVGQGSARETCLAIIQWSGDAPASEWIGLVAKGVCFDTGGISLKANPGMWEMKADMAGAAGVAAAMMLAARKALPLNIVAVIPLVENMPGGSALRPGDIIRCMAGKTIEITNTDAEGRLILADALHFCRQEYSPRLIVDLATLTGSVVAALGEEYAGLFSNDDPLATSLLKAAAAVGERLWRMPLDHVYRPQIGSATADLRNAAGPEAGSIKAALFLQEFVGPSRWAHIDMAGVALRKNNLDPTQPVAATGYGVRLLARFLESLCPAASVGGSPEVVER